MTAFDFEKQISNDFIMPITNNGPYLSDNESLKL